MHSKLFGLIFLLNYVQIHSKSIECPGLTPLKLTPALINTFNTKVFWTMRAVKHEAFHYNLPTISRNNFTFNNGMLYQDSYSIVYHKDGVNHSLMKMHTSFVVDQEFAIFEVLALSRKRWIHDKSVWSPMSGNEILLANEMGFKYALVYMEKDDVFHIMQDCDKGVAYLRVENANLRSYLMIVGLSEGYKVNEKMTEVCKQLNITDLHYYLKGREIFKYYF